MKINSKIIVLIAGLLLSASLTACNRASLRPSETNEETTASETVVIPTNPDETENAETASETTAEETTAEETSSPETTPSDSKDTTSAETTPSEPETDPAVSNALTADEAKSLIEAAIEADKQIQDGTANSITILNGEVISTSTITLQGDHFTYINTTPDSTESLIVVDHIAYYSFAYDDGFELVEFAHRVNLTDVQEQDLRDMYIGNDDSMGSDFFSDLFMNATWSGERLEDGFTAISTATTDTDGSIVAYDFLLSPDNIIAMTSFTITLPAEVADGTEYSISTETRFDYEDVTVEIPADASSYVESTFEDTFFSAPTADPDEAASLGLPLDGDNYIIGGENDAYDVEDQFWFLNQYALDYMDKTFIMEGTFTQDDWGDTYLNVGNDIEFWIVIPDGMEIPQEGTYARVTAIYAAYGMVASSVEILSAPADTDEGIPMYVTSLALNVRSTPDSVSDDNKVGILYMGNPVTVLETGFGEDGLWCKIRFDCDAGYAFVKITYLSDTIPDTNS